MEFVTSPAYSDVTRGFFAESLRPEVPPPDGARPLDDINADHAHPEDIEKNMPEVRELWRDIFGI